jgi:hypothetical protein
MWHKGELAHQNSIAPNQSDKKTSNTGEILTSDRSARHDRKKKTPQKLYSRTGSEDERPRLDPKKSKKQRTKPNKVATTVAHRSQAKKKPIKPIYPGTTNA